MALPTGRGHWRLLKTKVAMLRYGVNATDNTKDWELFRAPVSIAVVANVCRYVHNVRNRHDCLRRFVYHHRSTNESSR